MSTLKQLRDLMPPRALNHDEARWVAEQQALRLRTLTGTKHDPFLPREAIQSQPKIEVVYDPHLPQSGSSHWNGRVWQITINATEPFTRQRTTLAHEYKHVIDFPFDEYCYPSGSGMDADHRAEHYCDYFAACLLMPKLLVRQAWTAGAHNQDPIELGRIFGVSPSAVRLRLKDLGLLDPAARTRSGRTRAHRPRFRDTAHASHHLLTPPLHPRRTIRSCLDIVR